MRKLFISFVMVFSLIFTANYFAPPAESTTMKVGCVLYPNTAVGYVGRVTGTAEQQCFPGLYIKQRLRVKLQEKHRVCKLLIICYDEWHTKRFTTYSNWTTLSLKQRSARVECDGRRYHWWRVWVDGQFYDQETGAKRFGSDYSDEVYWACHVKADQTLPVS